MSIKIITFGCRLNTYESEIIKNFLNKNDNIKNKNITIFNSCTVTAEAEKQLRQAIRKEYRENKGVIIGVVGCAVQANKNIYQEMKEVNFILGNIDKMKLENYLFLDDLKFNNRLLDDKNAVSNVFNNFDVENNCILGFENRVRGFVQIQVGCDNYCSFCATRLARGSSFSLKPSKIINQINKLIENNYNEIVLTGINIVDYGKRLENDNINLGQLVKKILKETDLKRLRLSSLDVSGIDNDLKDVFFNEIRVMPHVHLSVQSGDNDILRKMNRRNTREDVLNFCNEIRRYRKNIGIGADIIAGFPTENDKQHRNTCNLILETNIVFGHIFPYSIRENTIAGTMEQVPMRIRRERAKELREIVKKQLDNFIQEQLKYKHQVLIETEKVGRTENYLTIKLDDNILNKYKIGDIVEL